MSEVLSARALVVFGKLPRPGRVKTRLGLPPAAAAELYAAFLADVFGVAEAALAERPGAGVFACALDDGEPLDAAVALAPAGWRVIAQRGADLGARMRSALRDAAARDAVLVGSDLPTLAVGALVSAFDALAQARAEGRRRVVLAPALDGGYVLVGVGGDAPALFEGIAWSTPAVLAETEAAAARAGLEVHRLSPVPDVDEPADLARLLPAIAADSRTGQALRALGLVPASREAPGRLDPA